MQYQDMHIGDQLHIGGSVLTLIEKSGRKVARFAIEADKLIPVKLVKSADRHVGYSNSEAKRAAA